MKKSANILLLDFAPASGWSESLCKILRSTPTLHLQKPNAVLPDEPLAVQQRCAELLAGNHPEAILLVLPQHSSSFNLSVLRSLKRLQNVAPVLIATEINDPHELRNLMEGGATDVILPPFQAAEVRARIQRVLDCQPSEELVQKLKTQLGLSQLIGESAAFRAALKKIPLIARCHAGVLICGETGTGKEMFAHAIHHLSPRAHYPFVPLNCGALPVELLENELFGHERGAFTDAGKSQPGLLREADGGSLFLDEVDGLPVAAQVKLLRFLQNKEYRPLGATKPRTANVRIIAASNCDLEEAVRNGKLRRDLYYRLSVIPLQLPALRERLADLPLLAHHFLKKYAAEFQQPVTSFSAAALDSLQHYDWPGNVRELEHLIARAVALTEHRVLEIEDLALPHHATLLPPASFSEAKARFERTYIEGMLQAHQGNISQAAQAARKNRRAFWELMRKHRINASHFKTAALS